MARPRRHGAIQRPKTPPPRSNGQEKGGAQFLDRAKSRGEQKHSGVRASCFVSRYSLRTAAPDRPEADVEVGTPAPHPCGNITFPSLSRSISGSNEQSTSIKPHRPLCCAVLWCASYWLRRRMCLDLRIVPLSLLQKSTNTAAAHHLLPQARQSPRPHRIAFR